MKTVNVIGKLLLPNGMPASNLEGFAVLNQYSVDSDVVVPASTQFKTNDEGEFSIDLWPNALGSQYSRYIVKARTFTETVLDVVIRVPDVDVPVNIKDIIVQQPYPPVNQALQVLLDIQETAVQINAGANVAIDAAEGALVSEQNAKDSELLSKDWAIKMDGLVDNEDFSAKHWATLAKDSSDQSASDVIQSSESAAKALVSEQNAKVSEDNAKQSEVNAKDSENVSLVQADIAIENASIAISKAESASLSEINAGLSSASALDSKNKSKISEDNAKDSELLSKDWAIKVDGPVVDDEYSSKFHAERSKVSSDASTLAAVQAATQAVNADVSLVEARTMADVSKEWATKTNGKVDGVDYSSKHYALLASQAIIDVDGAKTAATDANQSADNAKDSELLAESYKNEANTSKNLAKDWSIKIDGTVDGVECSAKYYANQAKTDSDLAGGYANSASSDASYINTRIVEAETAAGNAKTSETNAKSSEDLANTYKLEAKGYSESATASFNNINEIELLAEQYATNAATSELNAKTSETNSKTSELNAKSSEDSALLSATVAGTEAVKVNTGVLDASNYADDAYQSSLILGLIANPPPTGTYRLISINGVLRWELV